MTKAYEHADRTCRRLHFAGTSLGLLCLVSAIATRNLYSFLGDWVMWRDILARKIRF